MITDQPIEMDAREPWDPPHVISFATKDTQKNVFYDDDNDPTSGPHS